MKIIALLALSSSGLYGQWITGHYAPGGGPAGEPVSSIPWSKYTHIVHQNAWANRDGTISDYRMSETPEMVASRPAGKRLLIALGDNNSSTGFVNATSPGTIGAFVNNLVNYMTTKGYDGVELDWELNVNTTQYIDLISRLRAAVPSAIINMDVANYNNLTKIAAASQSNLDQIQVMCYDEDTAGDGITWYNGPLHQSRAYGGCDLRASQFVAAGVAAKKIGIGIPFWGRRWTGCTQTLQNGCTKVGYFVYGALATDSTRWQSQYQHYDTRFGSNYLSIPSLNEWNSYNGPEFMTDVVAWAKAQGYGGFMTYAQTDEYVSSQTGDARFPLSTVLYNAVIGDPGLRTQLIDFVVSHVSQIPASNVFGIQIDGYATLMNVDQWAYFYSEIRAPINLDGGEMTQVLNALGIPAAGPQRSSTLITVDQFIDGLNKVTLNATGSTLLAPWPYFWAAALLAIVLLVTVAGIHSRYTGTSVSNELVKRDQVSTFRR